MVAVVGDLDTPKSTAVAAHERRDRRRRAGAMWRVEERAVVERGEHITVHDEERLVEALDQLERSGGAQRLSSRAVVDVDAPAAAVTEVRLDELGEVADGERHCGRSPVARSCRTMISRIGVSPSGMSGLGRHRGVGAQPRAFAAREDDCSLADDLRLDCDIVLVAGHGSSRRRTTRPSGPGPRAA